MTGPESGVCAKTFLRVRFLLRSSFTHHLQRVYYGRRKHISETSSVLTLLIFSSTAHHRWNLPRQPLHLSSRLVSYPFSEPVPTGLVTVRLAGTRSSKLHTPILCNAREAPSGATSQIMGLVQIVEQDVAFEGDSGPTKGIGRACEGDWVDFREVWGVDRGYVLYFTSCQRV